jgi:hypothetical protein
MQVVEGITRTELSSHKLAPERKYSSGSGEVNQEGYSNMVNKLVVRVSGVLMDRRLIYRLQPVVPTYLPSVSAIQVSLVPISSHLCLVSTFENS